MYAHEVTPAEPPTQPYAQASCYLDLQGRITEANAAFTGLTGYPAADLRGQLLTQLLLPAERAPADLALRRALQGQVVELAVQLAAPAGPPQRLRLAAFPLLRQQALVGVGVQAQPGPATPPLVQVVQEQEQLAVIFRSISDIIFVLAVEAGHRYRFLFVNQAFEDVTGMPVDTVIGRLVQEIIPEPSLSLVRTVHDLTMQQRTEEALRASNERFAYALKATADAIYDWDVAADTRLWGEGFEALFGYPLPRHPAAFGQWSDFVHPDDAARTVDGLRHTALHTQQAHWQQEYRFRRADGSWATVLDRGYIIRDEEGRAIRMIGAMQDVTAHRAAEEKQHRMAQELFKQNADLQQFTYIVSHNLRAPLANARGFAGLLTRETKQTPGFDQALQHLQTSLKQLDTIIADVNTVLSVRNKAGVSRLEPVPLAAVCEQACQTLAPALRDCGGTIHCAIPDDLRVPGNRAYFHSIFYNLLANAIRYRSERRPLVVTVSGTAQPGHGVRLTVADNGLGLDLTKAGSNIFELYKRFHKIPGGRGIGLFLVKAHAEAMGGHVEVSSRVDEGTCFTLTFG